MVPANSSRISPGAVETPVNVMPSGERSGSTKSNGCTGNAPISGNPSIRPADTISLPPSMRRLVDVETGNRLPSSSTAPVICSPPSAPLVRERSRRAIDSTPAMMVFRNSGWRSSAERSANVRWMTPLTSSATAGANRPPTRSMRTRPSVISIRSA